MSRIEAKIVLDTIDENSNRITTMLVTHPRVTAVEILLYRAFSRTVRSSRSYPLTQWILDIAKNPYIPNIYQPTALNESDLYVPLEKESEEYASIIVNKKNRINSTLISCMKDLVGQEAATLEEYYKDTDELNIDLLSDLLDSYEWHMKHDNANRYGSVHRQLVTRDLEPYAWSHTIITSTDYENFFSQRLKNSSEPAIMEVADSMLTALASSTPREATGAVWHLPLLTEEEEKIAQEEVSDKEKSIEWAKVSANRCNTQEPLITEDFIPDFYQDIADTERNIKVGHLSPLEHPAVNQKSNKKIGNFKGWKQLRKFIPHEDNYSAALNDLT